MRLVYWLVNTGTVEEPWRDRIVERYLAWNAEHGPVQLFPFRPKQMTVGDVLIHRAVGSASAELLAVGDVVGAPHPSGDSRWPWQVERRLLHVCASLEEAPSAASAGIVAKGLRVMKRLEDGPGRTAQELIAAAGVPFPR